MQHVSGNIGVVLSTRLPANLFAFDSSGGFVTVVGGAVMKLAGGRERRRLEIAASDAQEPLDSGRAMFRLRVHLSSVEEASVKDVFISSIKNSAIGETAYFTKPSFIILGLVFSFLMYP